MTIRYGKTLRARHEFQVVEVEECELGQVTAFAVLGPGGSPFGIFPCQDEALRLFEEVVDDAPGGNGTRPGPTVDRV